MFTIGESVPRPPCPNTDSDPASRHDVCDAPFVSDLLLFVRLGEARRTGERRNGQKEEREDCETGTEE